MAYLNFSDIDGALTFAPAAPSTDAPARAPLTTLERTVVDLSRRDRLSSLTPAGTIGRWINRLFDLRPVNRLADERLEALRRFAVLSRTGRALNRDEQALLDFGYTYFQIEEARRLTGASDASRRGASNETYARLEMSVFTAGTRFWVRSGLSNSFMVSVLIAYLGLPIAMPAGPDA